LRNDIWVSVHILDDRRERRQRGAMKRAEVISGAKAANYVYSLRVQQKSLLTVLAVPSCMAIEALAESSKIHRRLPSVLPVLCAVSTILGSRNLWNRRHPGRMPQALCLHAPLFLSQVERNGLGLPQAATAAS